MQLLNGEIMSAPPQHPTRPQPLSWLALFMHRPWRLLFLFAGILTPLGLAANLAEDVLEKETLHFDVPILLWLHAHSTPALDRFFLAWTYAGGFIGTVVIVALGGVWLLRAGRRRALGFWLITMVGVGTLNVVIKLFFHRQRPTLWTQITPMHDYSFPSGHSMLSMSLGVALLMLLWPMRGQMSAVGARSPGRVRGRVAAWRRPESLVFKRAFSVRRVGGLVRGTGVDAWRLHFLARRT